MIDVTEGHILGREAVGEAVGTVEAAGSAVTKPATPPRNPPWTRDVTITNGYRPGRHLDADPVAPRAIAPDRCPTLRHATHHFGLHDFIEAYHVYERAPDEGAVKVVLAR